MSTEKKNDEQARPTLMVKGKPVSVRGATKVGFVVSTKAKNTAIVVRDYFLYNSKFKRKVRRRSRIPCHNPPEMNAQVGDEVQIAETRKLSKTKSWIILKVLGRVKLREKSEDVGVKQ